MPLVWQLIWSWQEDGQVRKARGEYKEGRVEVQALGAVQRATGDAAARQAAHSTGSAHAT